MWGLQRGLFRARLVQDSRLSQTLFGVTFPNPLGLAAGFDKNALALNSWHSLGFGFVECGTVTHLAQPGNPKPRLFRLSEDEALINRMGFNNDGASAVAPRIASSQPQIPVGINIGKSKLAELKNAADDYRASYQHLHRLGDYFVVNVSSPNTKGLRDLQDRDRLQEIFAALEEVDPTRPLFVKIAPDLEWTAIDDIIALCEEWKLTGIVAVNTTLRRENLQSKVAQEGGLSGKPLKARANDVLSYLYRNCSRETVLIGVGGISDGDDLYERIGLGAHLCQLYTGWIYAGPQMVPDSLERLVNLMERHGFKSLAELRGSRA
jgi:dihydroorotate dehydrogenase